MSLRGLDPWEPLPHPEWLQRINGEADCFELEALIPLDAESLINAACMATGLKDFGADHWREPFEILSRALDAEAELTLMGRLMARNDVLCWLTNRLSIEETFRCHPEISDQVIKAPLFICGLPRSGTSILYELMAQDPSFRVPKTWEAIFPCPPPGPETSDSDQRVLRGHRIATQWNRVAPEFVTMHEMSGHIPCECGMLMTQSFVSDQIASLHQTPSYAAWFAGADMRSAYTDHRRLLQLLQWKNPGRWLLKAPAHQNHLPILFETYPDAQVIQTHRDPIKCMASTTNLLGTLYWMRSDKSFDSSAFDNTMLAEAAAVRLEAVIDLTESGEIPPAQLFDSSYKALLEQPQDCVARIYRHFGMRLSEKTVEAMTQYLAAKPRHKYGEHRYQTGSDESICRDRALLARYQAYYNVPSEV
ncbi:MAG: sulfotransferase [Halieaceae bacterium]|jgi:hypothetical protein|nr:sulfotransferase [Halieaceae bacterium]